MLNCNLHFIVVLFLSACTVDDSSQPSVSQEQTGSLASERPVKEGSSSSTMMNTVMLVESRDMGSYERLPPVSNTSDSEALFHWRPIFNEAPESVGISLTGSAALDEQGLNLTGQDAFASYIFSPSSMVDEIKLNNEFFIRLWIKSAADEQEGPARIFTWSSGTDFRNLTLGHGNHQNSNGKLVVRLRLNLEEDSSALQGQHNGENIIESEDDILTGIRGWQRVELQYQEGMISLWIDEQLVIRELGPYDLSTWDRDMPFGFGQEFNQGRVATSPLRAWSGHIAEIAIYSKALKEVRIE